MPRISTNLFATSSIHSKCLKRVFEVYLRRLPERRDSLERKKRTVTVKFWGIIAAMTGRIYEWVGVLLEKRPMGVSCRILSVVGAPKEALSTKCPNWPSWKIQKNKTLNKSNPLRYMTSNTKNPKKKFCRILIPLLGSGSLAME